MRNVNPEFFKRMHDIFEQTENMRNAQFSGHLVYADKYNAYAQLLEQRRNIIANKAEAIKKCQYNALLYKLDRDIKKAARELDGLMAASLTRMGMDDEILNTQFRIIPVIPDQTTIRRAA